MHDFPPWARTPRPLGPRSNSIFLDERPDEPREPIRLFHLDAMTGGAHDLEPRLRQQGRVMLSRAPWYDFVVVAPDNQRRGAHSAQQMRQGLTVHVRLPGDAKAHLAAEVPIDELVGRHIAVYPREGLLIVEAGPRVVQVADDRLVKDVALGGLHPHRPAHHEPVELAGSHRRHLRRDPAAKAEADQRGSLDPELRQQPLVDDRAVAHAAQPLWSLRLAIPGMVWNEHVEAAGERVIKLELIRAADVVVQDQNRTPAGG